MGSSGRCSVGGVPSVVVVVGVVDAIVEVVCNACKSGSFGLQSV